MDLWDLTKLLLRRWYFVVPMLMLSVIAAVATGMSVNPDYSATGHLQLIPPAQRSEAAEKAGRPRNPWADLGMESIGNAAIIKVQTRPVVEKLVEGGFTDSFTITLEGSGTIIIETIGDSPAQASGSVKELIRVLNELMVEQQQRFRVNQQDTITTIVLDDGSNVTQVNSTVRRALIVVLGFGVLMTMALTIAIDAVLRRRARKRAQLGTTTSRRPRARGEDPVRAVAEAGESRQRVNGTPDPVPAGNGTRGSGARDAVTTASTDAPAPVARSSGASASGVLSLGTLSSGARSSATLSSGAPAPGALPSPVRQVSGAPAPGLAGRSSVIGEERPPLLPRRTPSAEPTTQFIAERGDQHDPATVTVQYQQADERTAALDQSGRRPDEDDRMTSVIAVVPPDATIVLPVLDSSWGRRDGKSER